MAEKSNIQWTDATWNIARGCTKVDEDCKYCYMYRDSMNNTRYDPLKVVRTKTVFDLPLKLKEPSKIFTCSLTDFFHESIDGYRNEAWDIIRKCPQHTFQILTKRPERIKDHLPADWNGGWDNVWLGTSCGSENSHQRIYDLCKVECKTRFLSLEPLHGEIDFYRISGMWPDKDHPWRNEPILHGIHWVIIGGESGNENGKYRYRPCALKWFYKIVEQCSNVFVNVPVFVKQMGTNLSKELGMSDRHGGNINEFPTDLQLREFPIIKS
jgi:protein gp37